MWKSDCGSIFLPSCLCCVSILWLKHGSSVLLSVFWSFFYFEKCFAPCLCLISGSFHLFLSNQLSCLLSFLRCTGFIPERRVGVNRERCLFIQKWRKIDDICIWFPCKHVWIYFMSKKAFVTLHTGTDLVHWPWSTVDEFWIEVWFHIRTVNPSASHPPSVRTTHISGGVGSGSLGVCWQTLL